MISFNLIWLFSLVSIAVIFLILLGISLFNSSLFGKEFSFLRNFPFEYAKINQSSFQIYKILLFVLSGLAFSPLFFIAPMSADFGGLTFLCILTTCVFGLSMISNVLLFFFDARYTKTHMALVTISMSLTFFANALTTLVGILVYKSYLDMSENHVGSLVLAIVSGLLTLVTLFLIINPKLTSWAKLESSTNEKGEKVVSRGKVFILALSEWLIIVLSVLGEIIYLLSLLK